MFKTNNRRSSQPKTPTTKAYIDSALSNLNNPRPIYIPSETGNKGSGSSVSSTFPVIVMIEEGDNVAIVFTNTDSIEIDIGGAIWIAEHPNGLL